MSRYLITGGAGFIGSHLVRALAREAEWVRVLDDFSTGRMESLEGVGGRVEVVRGDLRDLDTVRRAARGAEYILHHGALVSVPLSVADPVRTNEVNVGGTLNVLVAAREENARRVVFASSTAVYGNSDRLPKREDHPSEPLSPYAASKRIGEVYGELFHRLHAVPFVALRYFNVFGPGQDEDSPYAAAIPLFIRAFLCGEAPVVYGDGSQTRDFIYISDVVDSNLLALHNAHAIGRIFNIASGKECDINQLVSLLGRLVGSSEKPRREDPRPGDIHRSLGDTRLAREVLGFEPRTGLEEGLIETVAWYRKKISKEEGGRPERADGAGGEGR
ncbi:MAG: SDR family oxidoreductase [Candidatus Eisenbacteria bacterium]